MLSLEISHRFSDFKLDLTLESHGPALGIFGASGSGKTTLLHAIAGLFRPETGRIAVRERVVFARPGGVHLFELIDDRGERAIGDDVLRFLRALRSRHALLHATRCVIDDRDGEVAVRGHGCAPGEEQRANPCGKLGV